MSTFEGTMKERDKAHTAEIELEQKKQEELVALVVTLQQNRHEVQQRHAKIRNESVNRPSAQRDELITDTGEAAMNSEDDTIPKDTQPFQLAKDTEMQDNSSMVDSKWQIRSGNGPYISDSDGDNLKFYLDKNDEMNLVVRELYFQLEINYISEQVKERKYSSPIPLPHKYTRPRVPKHAYHKVNWDTPPKCPMRYIHWHPSYFYLTSESFSHSWPNYASSRQASSPV